MPDRPPTARATVRTLLKLEGELPDELRARIVSLGARAVPHLMQLLLDERLTPERFRWRAHPRVLAARLLAELGVAEAVEPAVRLLEAWMTEDDEGYASGELVQALIAFGPGLVEPALAACARGTPEDRWIFTFALARIGVRDERIFTALVASLARVPWSASDLYEYSDPRALEPLSQAFDRQPFETQTEFFQLQEVQWAITALKGSLTRSQRTKWRKALRTWAPHRHQRPKRKPDHLLN